MRLTGSVGDCPHVARLARGTRAFTTAAVLTALPALAPAVAVQEAASDPVTVTPPEVPAPPLDDPAGALTRANEAYAAGDFAAAASWYRALLDAGHDHAMLHYNLGNAYLRGGDLGRAIASYRRAAAAAPRDQDVRDNLAFARRNARDALQPAEPTAAMRTVFAWHYALAGEELWAAAGVLNLLLWSLLALRLWRRREWMGWAAAAVAVVLVACVGSLGVRALQPLRVAVVVPREIDVRAGTRVDAAVRFKLHAGSEVLVRERREGWLRVALPDGEQGWVEAETVEVVEL